MINTGWLHVKWFIGDRSDVPLSIGDVIDEHFLFWLGVTLFGLLVSSLLNEPLKKLPWIDALHRTLDRGKPYLSLILRIGLGIGLLLQLFTSVYLAPEFEGHGFWTQAVLVVAILGLLFTRTLPISGAAITVLYVTSIVEYGLFHALDYIFYAGIIYYLFVSNTKWRESATPALYLFTGLSLSWVGIEKMTLPGLAAEVVTNHAIPTFGFSVENFVLITAFIELGLAWTLIVGILNRFISLLVTLVFITTAAVFGFKEIVGHTILHTLLILFLIKGEGTFKTPFEFHNSLTRRTLFVLVNFCILLFGMMAIYIAIA